MDRHWRSALGLVTAFLCVAGSPRPGVAAELAGQTPGTSFEVSDAGSANFTIPLQLPPGTAGLVPELALAYSSQGQNGLLGVGWGMSGLSIIQRCPKTLATDGVYGKVDYSASDQLCLDADRLIHIAGTHGQAGGEYRTERETFTKVVIQDTPGVGLWFKVWTKAGRILEYGSTSDSRLSGIGGNVESWSLSRVADRSGNYYTATYHPDNTNGSLRPLRFDYTGNTIGPPIAPYASVRFEYDPPDPNSRPDVVRRYVRGGLRAVTKRMSKIQTFLGTTLVREYRLAYEISSGPQQSRLISITECAANGDCLRPVGVGWPIGAAPAWASQLGSPTPYDPNTHWLSGDVDGDGLTNVIAVTRASGNVRILTWDPVASGAYTTPIPTDPVSGNPPTPWAWRSDDRWFVGDFNGDGRADLVALRQGGGSDCGGPAGQKVLCLFTSNGAGSFVDSGWSLVQSQAWNEYFVGDYTGDGRSDFFSVSQGSGNDFIVWVAVSTGGAFSSSLTPIASSFSVPIGVIASGDFDGDGRVEAAKIYRNGSTWSIAIGVPGFPTTVTSYGLETYSQEKFAVVDANGDGISDPVIINHTDFGSGLRPMLGKGDWTFTQPGYSNLGRFGPDDTWFPANINGDGCQDLVEITHYGSVELRQAISRCDGTYYEPGSATILGSWQPEDEWMEVDYEGDGFDDLVAARKLGQWYPLTWKSSGQAFDLASSFGYGLGGGDQIAYGTLAEAALYTKGTGAVFPSVDFVGPLHVVKQRTRSNGTAPVEVLDYAYASARVNRYGRGWLGFQQRTVVEQSTGRRTVTEYHQDFPREGLALSEQVRSSPAPGVLLGDAQSTWVSLSIPLPGAPTRYRVELRQSITNSRELDGSLVVQTTTTQYFDDYGNLEQVTASRSQGPGMPVFIDATSTTYRPPDLANWLLGLVDLVTVQASAPGVPTLSRSIDIDTDPVTGLLDREVADPGQPFELSTTYGRDRFGNVETVLVEGGDIDDRTTTFVYEPNGRYPQTETNVEGHAVGRGYDHRFGTVTSEQGPDLAITFARVPDSLGRLQQLTNPDQTTVLINRQNCTSCPVAGAVYLEQVAASGVPTTTRYIDNRGRVISTRTVGFSGSDVVAFDNVYDAAGRISATSQPYYVSPTPSIFWTTREYDLLDRVWRLTLPEAPPNQYITAFDGLVRTITNPLGQVRTETFTELGELSTVAQPLDQQNVASSVYAYDAFGNLTGVADTYGNSVFQAWDVRGQKRSLNDPDLGLRTYDYYASGELKSIVDAKSQTRSFTYDRLGRPQTRVEPTDTTTWTWDSAPNGMGQLGSVATTSAITFPVQRAYSYDGDARVSGQTTTIEGTSYSVAFGYDTAGRVDVVTYPTGTSSFAVQNVFNANNYLYQIKRQGAPGTVYWQANTRDPYQQVKGASLGNGLQSVRDFDPRSGRTTRIQTGTGPQWAVQDLEYEWFTLGNLKRRKDVDLLTEEVMGYDALNRLRTITGTGGAPSKSYDFDLVGNMTFKTGVGAMSYPAQGLGVVRPHAVTNAGGRPYQYDLNGNNTYVLGFGGRLSEYYSFDKPKISLRLSSLIRSEFAYGPDRDLVRHQERDANGAIAVRTIIGDLYEKSVVGSDVEHRYYIRAGGELIAIHKDTSTGPQLRYVHTDHLGSTSVLTRDTDGGIDKQLSFDAWGRRRNPNWTDPPGLYSFAFDGGVGRELSQGFTSHTALDHLELVHMGGRVYDPVIGRFLSPDPFVQSPDSPEGFNRYAYGQNRPLSGTDPTGFFDGGGGDFGAAFGNVGGGGLHFNFTRGFERLNRVAPAIHTLLAWANASVGLVCCSSGPQGGGSPGIWFSVGMQSGVNDGSVSEVFRSFAEGAAIGDILGDLARGRGSNPLGDLQRGGLAIPLSITDAGATPCSGELCNERFGPFDAEQYPHIYLGESSDKPLPGYWFGPEDALLLGTTAIARKLGSVAERAAAATFARRAEGLAARGARNPAVREAAEYGRKIHKTYDYGPGFEREFRLPSGRRADAVNLATREVLELKPNNPQALQRGERQLETYLKELEQTYGGEWTGRVVPYDR